jgi:hypothetical protein
MEKPFYLKKVHPSELMYLYELCESVTVPLLQGRAGRAKKFGIHRAMVMGMSKPRCSSEWGLSSNSKKYCELHEELMRIGNEIVPFDFETVHMNHNVQCPPHYDSNNVGNSVVLSIGDYEGCNLVIENFGEFDTNCHPVLFNASKLKHWNTPLLKGNKYSFVFTTQWEKN